MRLTLKHKKELAATKIPEFSDPNKADSFKLNMRNSLRIMVLMTKR